MWLNRGENRNRIQRAEGLDKKFGLYPVGWGIENHFQGKEITGSAGGMGRHEGNRELVFPECSA